MTNNYLKELDTTVKILLEDSAAKEIITNLKSQIQKSSEPFVWGTIETLPRYRLPSEFKSIWIFVLKRNAPSIAHYHPNSIQHTIMVEGKGKAKIGNQYKKLKLFNPLDKESWCIIGQNAPHEFFPEEREMVVISFHTCLGSELIEIKWDGGEKRLYKLK